MTASGQFAVKTQPTLRLLGPFRLTDGEGRPIEIGAKRNRALLAMLALSPARKASREFLWGRLWADRGEEQARSSLRQSLALLRKDMAGLSDFLLVNADFVQLSEALIVDAPAFITAARSGDLEGSREAINLYEGPLLADLSLKQEGFENWLEEARRTLEDLAIQLLDRLAATGNPTQKIEFAKRLVNLDPLREESQRLLIKAYLDAGELGLAMRHFDQFKALLKSELGVEPAPQTLTLKELLEARAVVGLSDAAIEPSLRAATTLPVAVLPLRNLSGDPSQQDFADGISDDIAIGLTRFRSLAVVSRTASFRYRGDLDPQAAGRSLGAKYLVEGSIKRAVSRIRVSVQLVNASTGQHEWAESFDVPEAQLFEVQDEVVQKVVSTLFGRIHEAGVHHARLKPPSSLAAYELVIKANALDWEKSQSADEALQLLRQALQIDSGYAMAHALLAAVELRNTIYKGRITPLLLTRVLEHARKAVDLEPNDSACHSILSWVLLARSEPWQAEEHVRRALSLNPNNPFAMVHMGSLQVQCGRPDEALQWFDRAHAVDPHFRPSWIQEKLGLAHFAARRYHEADAHFRRAMSLRFHMQGLRAGVQAVLGNEAGAQETLRKALIVRPDLCSTIVHEILPFQKNEDVAHLGETLARAGLKP